MAKNIAIIDYNVGNLLNVANACEYLGTKAQLISSPDAIGKADYLILPGVGSSQEGMKGLQQYFFIEAIREYCRSGKGLLGICLGMQLLADSSDEGGTRPTLGLIPGRVTAIPSTNHLGQRVVIPNINWLNVRATRDKSPLIPLLQDNRFYFVHSYQFSDTADDNIVATTSHQGITINAMVQKDNVIGCQFHPEKSSHAGLNLLRYFINNF